MSPGRGCISFGLLSHRLHVLNLLEWLYQFILVVAVHIFPNTRITQISDFCHDNSCKIIPCLNAHFSDYMQV